MFNVALNHNVGICLKQVKSKCKKSGFYSSALLIETKLLTEIVINSIEEEEILGINNLQFLAVLFCLNCPICATPSSETRDPDSRLFLEFLDLLPSRQAS